MACARHGILMAIPPPEGVEGGLLKVEECRARAGGLLLGTSRCLLPAPSLTTLEASAKTNTWRVGENVVL